MAPFGRTSILFRVVGVQRRSMRAMVEDLRGLARQFREVQTEHRAMADRIASSFEGVASNFANVCEQLDVLLVDLGDPAATLDPVDTLVGLARMLPPEDLVRLRARLEGA